MLPGSQDDHTMAVEAGAGAGAVGADTSTRTWLHRPGWLAVPLLALALVVGACASASDNSGGSSAVTADADGRVRLDFVQAPSGEPQSGGDLTFAVAAETDGWRVTDSRWAASATIVGGSMFDPLAAYDDDFLPQPFLAQGFEHDANFTTWTITLRPGVSFHDGTPVDGAAVARNLQAHQTALLTSTAVSFIDTVTASGPLEVTVTMKKPWSTFPDVLTSQVGYIMAPAMIDDPDGARNPVGSGPFRFERWAPGQSLRVARNDDYWRDGLPYLDSIEFQVLSDIQTRSRSMESGGIQAMETGDAAQILRFADLASQGRFQMYSDDNLEVAETFIGLNTAKPPFDDPLAREALAYSIDRQALSDQAYESLFPPAVGPFQPSSEFYIDAGVAGFDPDRSRDLVAQYEEKYGKPLAFSANILPVPEIKRIAETLQQQAADVGIQVTLDAMDQPTLLVRALTGNYEATGFILFGSPLLDREYVFIADYPTGNPLNFTRNANPKIVEALDAARSTADRAVQTEQFAIVQRELAKDRNFVFMVHNLAAVVYADRVFGIADQTLPDGGRAGRTVTPRLAEAWLQR
jgi:peptide/nickel transport system substrate-binding protein